MRKCIGKLVLPLLIVISAPLSSWAWGLNGHRIVGEIAGMYLTPKAKAAIARILGNETMAMTSNWPDFIKSDPAYNYLSAWHYVDFEASMTDAEVRSALGKDTALDAYNRINFLAAQLKDGSLPQDRKLMYLRLLIHIVGDVHQPFHVGHSSDQGGNRVQVQWFGQNSNIHRVWDEQLIDYQQLSYTEYTKAINHITPARRSALQAESVADWILDSRNLSEKLYAEINASDKKLSYRYNFLHVAELNDQLLKGGVRLAGLLNRIFA